MKNGMKRVVKYFGANYSNILLAKTMPIRSDDTFLVGTVTRIQNIIPKTKYHRAEADKMAIPKKRI